MISKLIGLVVGMVSAFTAMLVRLRVHKIAPSPERVLFGGDYTGQMMTRVDTIFAEHADPLLRGEIEAAARQRYPAEAWPELWKQIPADIVKPIAEDGRLLTGEKLAELAPRLLSRATVERLYAAAGRLALRAHALGVFFALLAGILAAVATFAFVSSSISKKVNASLPGAQVSIDNWSQKEVDQALASAKFKRDALKAAGTTAAVGGAALAAAGGGFVVFVGTIAGFWLLIAWWMARPSVISSGVHLVVNSDVRLTLETKEAIVRWKYRQDARALERRAYLEQIEAVEQDTLPTVQLGEGTGTMMLRGSLQSIGERQACAMSLDDLSQGILCLGGTGQGKSFAFLLPLLRQWVALQKRRGAGPTMAAYVADGKGVLWQSAVAVARGAGLADDKIRVIGCGPGEWGVDLFDGLPPHIAAEALNLAMTQLGAAGGTADPFWMSMATRVIEASAKIAHVAELTNFGLAYVDRTGERLYSPAGIEALAFAGPVNSLLSEAIDGILAAYEASPADVAAHSDAGLVAAVDFMLRILPDYPDATRGSILSNVTNVLGGFTMLSAVRSRFGAASSERMLNVDSIFEDGTITTVNLPATEWGAAGRVANIMCKIRLYHRARVRNIADPEIGLKSKVLMMMDECQDLITAGSGGFAETSFLNYSRSTGLCFVLATQGLPAIAAALGETDQGQKSENLVQQLRSKVILQIEDLKTLKFVQGLFGKVLRSYTDDWDQHESFAAASFERSGTLVDFDVIRPIEVSDAEAGEMVSLLAGQIGAMMQQLYHTDWRFTAAQGNDDGIDRLKAVLWRAEDKRLERIRHGWHEASLVQDGDMAALGRGQAIAYVKRGGHSRTDIIRLTPEIGI
jgi:hypothetical protein